MAKITYMVTADYVRDWTRVHAIREIIANGIDAEYELGAELVVSHEPKAKILRVKNLGTKLDSRSLYFGGSTKYGNQTTIGQYGEGLKLALLIFAREGIKCVLRNDDETWTPKIEEDERGVPVLTIYTRASDKKTGNLEVGIHDVDLNLWYEIETMFLRLAPKKEQISTSLGEILLDPDCVGRVYVRGVYVNKRPESAFGYNFKHLSVGRDRKSYDTYDVEIRVQQMLAEAATQAPDFAKKVFDGFVAGAQDLGGAAWASALPLTDALVTEFHARYGEDALPVTGLGEAQELEHLGAQGVVLPGPLTTALRRKLPGVAEFRRTKQRATKKEYAWNELTDQEKSYLRDSFTLLKSQGSDVSSRVKVVDFEGEGLEGLHRDQEILLARKCLKTFGKTMGVLIHEAAHDLGVDGSAGHVDGIHSLMEGVLTAMYEEGKETE